MKVTTGIIFSMLISSSALAQQQCVELSGTWVGRCDFTAFENGSQTDDKKVARQIQISQTGCRQVTVIDGSYVSTIIPNVRHPGPASYGSGGKEFLGDMVFVDSWNTDLSLQSNLLDYDGQIVTQVKYSRAAQDELSIESRLDAGGGVTTQEKCSLYKITR